MSRTRTGMMKIMMKQKPGLKSLQFLIMHKWIWGCLWTSDDGLEKAARSFFIQSFVLSPFYDSTKKFMSLPTNYTLQGQISHQLTSHQVVCTSECCGQCQVWNSDQDYSTFFDQALLVDCVLFHILKIEHFLPFSACASKSGHKRKNMRLKHEWWHWDWLVAHVLFSWKINPYPISLPRLIVFERSWSWEARSGL